MTLSDPWGGVLTLTDQRGGEIFFENWQTWTLSAGRQGPCWQVDVVFLTSSDYTSFCTSILRILLKNMKQGIWSTAAVSNCVVVVCWKCVCWQNSVVAHFVSIKLPVYCKKLMDFMIVCLLFKDVSNLQQALEAYTRREILDRENSYNCERLNNFLKKRVLQCCVLVV